MNDMARFGVESILRLGVGSTMLLLMGLIAIVVCRRQSAAMQYWVGTWTCLALLCLAPAVILLPSWQVNFLGLNVQITNAPAEQSHGESTSAALSLQRFPDDADSADVVISSSKEATHAFAPSSRIYQAQHEEDLTPREISSQHIPTVSRFRIAVSEQVALASILIYLIGLVLGILRLVMAHNRVREWVRSSRCVSTEVARIAKKSSEAMGLVDLVVVRRCQQIEVPVVVGMLRPMILLPYSVDRWPEQRLSAALTHELSHVERCDLWTQFIIQIVTCLFWPQPLVYWMSSVLRARREVACDDRALDFYERPAHYARHLLEVAAELSGNPQSQSATLAMARTPQIESRIMAILSSTRRRSPPTREVVVAMALLTMVGMLVSASASPFTPPQADVGNSSSAAVQGRGRILHTVRGRVLSPDGRPAGGARIRNLPSGKFYPKAKTKTDVNGNFELILAAASYHPPLIADSDGLCGIVQVAVDASIKYQTVEIGTADTVLKLGRRIEVEVVDKSQAAVAGAAVYLQANGGVVERLETDAQGRATFVYPEGLRLQTLGAVKAAVGCDYYSFEKLTDGEQAPLLLPKHGQDFVGKIRLHLDGVREANVKLVGPSGEPLAGVLLHSGYSYRRERDNVWVLPWLPEFARETDADGIARFDMFSLHENGGVAIAPLLESKNLYVVGNRFGLESATIVWGDDASAEIQLAEKLLVGGNVRYADGRPAAGIAIRAAGASKFFRSFEERVVSDEHGNWQMWVKPNGFYLFAVHHQEFASPPRSGVVIRDSNPPRDLDFKLEPARIVTGRIPGLADDVSVILQQRTQDHASLPKDERLPNMEDVGRPITAMIEDSRQVGIDGRFEFRVGPGEFTILSSARESYDFTITDQPAIDLGELRKPLPLRQRGFQPPAKLAAQAFRSDESLQHRYTQLSREAQESNQQLLIIAGSDSNQSTIDLYGVLNDREVQLSLASYRQLPVNIVGDNSALNRKFLQTILGREIDASGTHLIILGNDRQIVSIASVSQWQSDGAPLRQSLLKFALKHQSVFQRKMTVFITDEAGKPLANANVFRNHVFEFEQDKPQIENINISSDADGRAVVPLSGTSVDLRLWVTLDGFVPLHAMWAKSFQSDGEQIPKEFTFRMQAGTEVGGIVIDENGQPVSGAIVEVREPAVAQLAFGLNRDVPGKRPVRWSGLAEGDTAVITDDDGKWALGNVPSDKQLDAPELLPWQVSPLQKLSVRVTAPGQEKDENGYGRLQREQNISHLSLRNKSAKFVVPTKGKSD